jgi:hypothetical protein
MEKNNGYLEFGLPPAHTKRWLSRRKAAIARRRASVTGFPRKDLLLGRRRFEIARGPRFADHAVTESSPLVFAATCDLSSEDQPAAPGVNLLRRSGTSSLKVMKDADPGALDRALGGDQQF